MLAARVGELEGTLATTVGKLSEAAERIRHEETLRAEMVKLQEAIEVAAQDASAAGQRLLEEQRLVAALRTEIASRRSSPMTNGMGPAPTAGTLLPEGRRELDATLASLNAARRTEAELRRQLDLAQRKAGGLEARLAELENSAFMRVGRRWIRLRQKHLDNLTALKWLLDMFHAWAVRGQDAQRREPRAVMPNAIAPNALEPLDPDSLEPVVFPPCATPVVSIIVPSFTRPYELYECLRSIAEGSGGIEYEVLVADDASNMPELTHIVERKIQNAHCLMREENVGYIRNCNAAADAARGTFLVFLNQDVVVEPGWLESLLAVIGPDETVAAVGAKLVYPDGRLQEAGGIIWRDMSAANYGRGDDPDKWDYNYVREVDYCSGACLITRTSTFHVLGRFSEELAPAYGDDSDYAMKARAQGLRVMYQPAAVVVHREGTSMGTDTSTGLKSYQERNKLILREKWQKDLVAGHQRSDVPQVLARERNDRPRMLFIDHYVPMWDKDSGSLRMREYLDLFMSLGIKITMWPANLFPHQPYTHMLQQVGVEVVYGSNLDFPQFLRDRASHFDFVYGSRSWIMKDFIDSLGRSSLAGRIVYDPHDLAFIRERRQAELEGDSALLRAAAESERQERRVMASADVIVSVSTTEQDIVQRWFPDKPTILLQSVCEPRPPRNTFEARNGLLFVGGFKHRPNVDAVEWFVEAILPEIHRRLPGLPVYVVGSDPPEAWQRLTAPGFHVAGFQDDLGPWFERARVFIAPLRYGAGEKGKIANSLSRGLPVVTTPIGAEGMNVAHHREVLIAESASEFADQVCVLHEDNARWAAMSHAAVGYAQDFHSRAAMRSRLQGLVSSLGVHRSARSRV